MTCPTEIKHERSRVRVGLRHSLITVTRVLPRVGSCHLLKNAVHHSEVSGGCLGSASVESRGLRARAGFGGDIASGPRYRRREECAEP